MRMILITFTVITFYVTGASAADAKGLSRNNLIRETVFGDGLHSSNRRGICRVED